MLSIAAATGSVAGSAVDSADVRTTSLAVAGESVAVLSGAVSAGAPVVWPRTRSVLVACGSVVVVSLVGPRI
jgi:hypothetical protein